MNQLLNRDATFATTHWTLVLEAQDTSSPQALAALGELCRTYWYPLYAYARGRGHAVEDAQDLTQEFFCRLLEKNYLRVADRKKGMFRWFLLTAFKCFLANEYDRNHAEKRGGGRPLISLNAVEAEKLYQLEPSIEASPDHVFDRRWAITLLETVRRRLRAEYSSQGKDRRYTILEEYLPGERARQTYAAAGAQLGLSEGAIKVEVHRMKQRFGELLRAEIAHTVAAESKVDEELNYLVQVLARE